MNILNLESEELQGGIYFLKGDSYLCKKAKNIILQKLNVSEINVSLFNDENFNALEVYNACNQYSFFDDYRAVIVDDLQKDLSAKDKELFLSYSNNQNDKCVLIVENNNGYFDFIKNSTIVDCSASESYILNYIKQTFNGYKKDIDSENCKMLNLYCLSNLNKINIEIKKISDYLNNQTTVTADVIDLLVHKDTEIKVFELTTLISNKNKDKALTMLKQMQEAGEEPIKILGLINGHFRRMFFAKINKGTNLELANALGCKEYAVSKAKSQAEKFGANALKNILNLLLETDYNIKAGVMTPDNALYYAVLSILNM